MQIADRAELMGDHIAKTSSIEMYREAVNAEHHGEVAPLESLAVAINKYEDVPHGDDTVREGRPRGDDIPRSVRHARQPSRNERLGA